MPKVVSLLIALVFSIAITAQDKPQEKAIKSVIETFFKGLHNGDSIIMSKTLHKDIKIQTTNTNNDGIKVLKTETRKQLLTSIANKKPTQVLFEKLLSFDIKIDGNLAAVWTPYEFYFNGNFSHCGANSFQLFNNNGIWEIIFLVDMRRTQHCKELKEKK